jgi:hypothetical protein
MPADLAHWPPALPQHLTLPETTVFYNGEVSAARFAGKPIAGAGGSARRRGLMCLVVPGQSVVLSNSPNSCHCEPVNFDS